MILKSNPNFSMCAAYNQKNCFQLIPSSGSLVALLIGLIFILFVYRMVLHGFTIMAVHDLSAGRATLIVLIIPMLIVGLIMLAMLVFLIFTGGEVIGGLLEGFEWIPGGHGTPKKAKTPE